MAQGELLEVEIVYALPMRQTILTLNVAAGTTVIQAVAASGIARQHPEIDMKSAVLGIFGKRVGPDTVLKPHDRVEIYRPLLIDPKTARRLRAAKR
jgi:putative ubiquitin-RnfH superfamily antitoxin RatB of RatAB toxin-antitoxin module